MTSLSDVKKTYREVQEHLNTDPALEHWGHRERKCRALYKDIVKSEPAIMEWEVNYWGRYGKWGLPLLCVLLAIVFPVALVMAALTKVDSVHWGALIGLLCFLSGPITIIALGSEWYPTRYYQKITASGFYSYGIKTGMERRQAMAKYCMMGGGVVALLLLVVAGPLAFAGAGAASLSFLKMGAVKEQEPEESAWPWLGIYSIVRIKKPFLYNLYKIETHGDNVLILTEEQLEQVKTMVKEYGQHELDVVDKMESPFFDRWLEHQDTMPFRQAE